MARKIRHYLWLCKKKTQKIPRKSPKFKQKTFLNLCRSEFSSPSLWQSDFPGPFSSSATRSLGRANVWLVSQTVDQVCSFRHLHNISGQHSKLGGIDHATIFDGYILIMHDLLMFACIHPTKHRIRVFSASRASHLTPGANLTNTHDSCACTAMVVAEALP